MFGVGGKKSEIQGASSQRAHNYNLTRKKPGVQPWFRLVFVFFVERDKIIYWYLLKALLKRKNSSFML